MYIVGCRFYILSAGKKKLVGACKKTTIEDKYPQTATYKQHV